LLLKAKVVHTGFGIWGFVWVFWGLGVFFFKKQLQAVMSSSLLSLDANISSPIWLLRKKDTKLLLKFEAIIWF